MKTRTSENSKKINDLKIILCGLFTGFIIAAPPMALLWWTVVPTESIAVFDKITALIEAGLLIFAIIRITQHINSIWKQIEEKLENRAC